MDITRGFRNQILKGTAWIGALEVFNQGLQFIKTFYAATILTPEDFGIIGFTFLIISFVDVLSTTGLKEAIIHRKDNVTSYLDTVWLTEVGKGLIVLLFAVFAGPLVVSVINPDNAVLIKDVVKLIGAIYFLQCLTSIGVVFFEKHIEFKKYFFYQVSGTVVDVTVSLILVYYLHSVWGLFYGVLAGSATRVLFSFLLTEFKPKFEFSVSKLKELLAYGKWIFKGRIFNFVGLQADSILVSIFFNLSSLGIYQMAFRIGNLPMSQASNIIGRLAFPAFSKVQDDHGKLREFFLLALNILAILLMPIVILIFCFIDDFTLHFLGDKWNGIVPIVRVLILSGFLRIFVSIIDSLFCAIGQPIYSSRLQMTRSIIFIILAAILWYPFGLVGIALSGLLSLLAVLLFFIEIARKKVQATWKDLFDDWVMPLLFGLFVSISLLVTKFFLHAENIIYFFTFLLVGFVWYVAMGFAFAKLTPFKPFGKLIKLLT